MPVRRLWKMEGFFPSSGINSSAVALESMVGKKIRFSPEFHFSHLQSSHVRLLIRFFRVCAEILIIGVPYHNHFVPFSTAFQ